MGQAACSFSVPCPGACAWLAPLVQHLGGEHHERRTFFPVVRGQARFAGQLCQHGVPVPALFGGHLGQKHGSVAVFLQDNTVQARLNGFR